MFLAITQQMHGPDAVIMICDVLKWGGKRKVVASYE